MDEKKTWAEFTADMKLPEFPSLEPENPFSAEILKQLEKSPRNGAGQTVEERRAIVEAQKQFQELMANPQMPDRHHP